MESSRGEGRESRERILEVTLQLAAERGYHGTTVAAVAERSGLPVSSIYWHFANKDELLAEALRRGRSAWRDRVPVPDDELPSTLGEAIAVRLRLGAQFVAENLPYVRFGTQLVLQQGLGDSLARRDYLASYDVIDSLLLEWWTRLLPPPLHEDGWPAHFAEIHIAFVEGLQPGVLTEGWDGLHLAELVAAGLAAQVDALAAEVSR